MQHSPVVSASADQISPPSHCHHVTSQHVTVPRHAVLRDNLKLHRIAHSILQVRQTRHTEDSLAGPGSVTAPRRRCQPKQNAAPPSTDRSVPNIIKIYDMFACLIALSCLSRSSPAAAYRLHDRVNTNSSPAASGELRHNQDVVTRHVNISYFFIILSYGSKILTQSYQRRRRQFLR